MTTEELPDGIDPANNATEDPFPDLVQACLRALAHRGSAGTRIPLRGFEIIAEHARQMRPDLASQAQDLLREIDQVRAACDADRVTSLLRSARSSQGTQPLTVRDLIDFLCQFMTRDDGGALDREVLLRLRVYGEDFMGGLREIRIDRNCDEDAELELIADDGSVVLPDEARAPMRARQIRAGVRALQAILRDDDHQEATQRRIASVLDRRIAPSEKDSVFRAAQEGVRFALRLLASVDELTVVLEACERLDAARCASSGIEHECACDARQGATWHCPVRIALRDVVASLRDLPDIDLSAPRPDGDTRGNPSGAMA